MNYKEEGMWVINYEYRQAVLDLFESFDGMRGAKKVVALMIARSPERARQILAKADRERRFYDRRFQTRNAREIYHRKYGRHTK